MDHRILINLGAIVAQFLLQTIVACEEDFGVSSSLGWVVRWYMGYPLGYAKCVHPLHCDPTYLGLHEIGPKIHLRWELQICFNDA